MARVLAEFPEIVEVSVRWGAHESAVLHGRVSDPRRDAIVRQYSYVDLGLEFCNTALAAHSKRWVAKGGGCAGPLREAGLELGEGL